MKILITGYSGFVGSYVAHSLHSEHELKFLGRKPSDLAPVYKSSIDATSEYTEALKDVEVVIHCAARVHVMYDKEADPLAKFREVNTDGTLNLARQAAAAGVKRFIFLSSIKVNGESTTGRKPFQSQDAAAPIDPYGISKAEAEAGLIALGQTTGMEVVIIRPPLVYGKGVKANFASLMRLVGKGFPLPFRLIHRNKRSLVSVYNLVDLIKVCIDHPNAANQIFLVSDDHDLSTAEMVSLMAMAQGKKHVSLPVPVFLYEVVGKILRKQDVIDRLTGSLQVDISFTKERLDWKPPYSIEDGFKRTSRDYLD
ncbi:UDP-glucose 4-epimerase family protein [Pseudoalteromonas rubra]|uniref:UDP-glucose 4-epimerase family protein n=1 Tax=Pseudoalteromonas rubra TaxID=43658 RepID=UPI000F77FE7F|nr:SDR family oxidoreductase [Pseudoalteromonas rubra]